MHNILRTERLVSQLAKSAKMHSGQIYCLCLIQTYFCPDIASWRAGLMFLIMSIHIYNTMLMVLIKIILITYIILLNLSQRIDEIRIKEYENKCSDRDKKVKLPALLENYDRQCTYRPTYRWTDSVIGKFHFQLNDPSRVWSKRKEKRIPGWLT